jgi:hypothetical protein
MTMETESLRQRKGFKYTMLLALKMSEWAISHEMQVVSKSQKRHENRFSPRAIRKNSDTNTPVFSPLKFISKFDFENYKSVLFNFNKIVVICYKSNRKLK